MKNAISYDHSKNEDEEEKVFYFEGQPINKDRFKHIGVFTTMNPGYAGRTELPDNLKVLFRSVCMMVPDYALIAEILLFSEGFFDAKDLAIKMTKLYKLASEQLSQQRHYDFGMRAVKSILSMAGNLKRTNPDEDEDMLLIQAMRDVNLPKFLEDDIKLFQGIVQDLFPGKVHEKKNDEKLVKKLLKIVDDQKLQPIPAFIEKCLQFHDIMKIRFGSMLVGPPMTGKSAVLHSLRRTYNELASEELDEETALYHVVDCVTMNPKSITMGELYGETNPFTGDFSNGLASKVFTDFAVREKKEMKWIVFDGPVDSLWIENLNSVLDDSMTLCLSNGKRIKLKFDIRVLFEVQDLNEASPATVSRVGMVYFGAGVIDSLELTKTLLEHEFKDVDIPAGHKEQYIDKMDSCFEKITNYLRKSGREPIKTINNNLILSFVRILKTFYFGDYQSRIIPEDEEEALKKENSIVTKMFIFAISWSMIATGDENLTNKLEQIAANLFQMLDLPLGSLFDSFLDFSEKEFEWKKWETMSFDFEYNLGKKWFDLVVPTINTKRYAYMIRKAITGKYPMYITGVTGTGKTIIWQNLLKDMSDEELITPLTFTFSAKTSSSQVQALITSKMNTLRRDKDGEKIFWLIPKNPHKTLVIFVDDINMPETEQYGAQPPIELLRQVVDHGGFYDRVAHQWRQLENTILIAASVPPGQGRNPLSQRFMRHFHIVNIHASGDEIMQNIFGTILKNFMEALPFTGKVQAMDEALVTGTLQIYREMQMKMLPTPKKPHYTFNLRDVSKVFQGIVQMRPEKFKNHEIVPLLWIHELTRVFSDRLIDAKDREYFLTLVSAATGNVAGKVISVQEIVNSNYLFGDFMNQGTRDFEYLDKFDKVIKQISTYMLDTKVNIELFKDWVNHLCRINRILRQTRGNALLIGIGGSGKKSLITVASEMAATILVQIEPTKNYGLREFRKEVFERMLHPAGILGQDISFMFTDTNVLEESFLEEVSNIINTGEIILEKELMDRMRKDSDAEMAKLKINEDPYEFYVQRVREHLHIVLAMSPIGDALRTRVRNFPSFVN